MNEVLPSNKMWEEWERNESKARQGKGYYPSLDRRFLEFLVACEIDLLSIQHNLTLEQPAERVHRNTDKVRRVASQRIGNERLEAYCARVREAFKAYFDGSVWATWEDDAFSVNSLEEEYVEKPAEVEERGRIKTAKEIQGTSLHFCGGDYLELETHSHTLVSKQVEKMDTSVTCAMEVDQASPLAVNQTKIEKANIQTLNQVADQVKRLEVAGSAMEVDGPPQPLVETAENVPKTTQQVDVK
ncbi:hypothetical protein QFC22_004755 [Naganishia vaughanmartiniae]|uniref:Uncharacterized protein n=1 Tax=Naganishia vaughanmartiniae TaxID=1424756 RepID=A0ACC2WYC2_9TREE|nr:hypothetical protein QFC22_004755 [Naganishia vaughanmartiniae]